MIKSKDKTRACQRKGALSNWKVHLSKYLSSQRLAVAENGKDDHQVLEEARDQRGRSSTRDVGARRGDNSESKQEEEGKGLRHLLCPRPRPAASCVSLPFIHLAAVMSTVMVILQNVILLFSFKKSMSCNL